MFSLLLFSTLLFITQAEILTSVLPPRPPTCGENCLVSYSNSAHRASCSNSDSSCICRDPLFSPFVACCLASCPTTDIDVTVTYLRYVCAQAAIDLPNLKDCNAAKADTATGVRTLDVTFVNSQGSIVGIVGGAATEATATTHASAETGTATTQVNGSSAPASSTSALATEKALSSGLTTAKPSQPPSSAAALGTTQPSALPPPPGQTTSSSHPSVPNVPLTLGLSLGFGIPLTVAAVGLISYLFYRHRRLSSNSSDTTFGDIGTWNVGQATYPTEWKPEMAGSAGDRYKFRGQRAWGQSGVELPS